MIESGNSYGIPRYLVEFSSSFKNIDIYFSLSDGILDKKFNKHKTTLFT